MARPFTLPLVALVLAGGFGTLVAFTNSSSTTTTPASSTTTSTTIALERAQPNWAVASSSKRGVMTDYRNEIVGTATFRVLRLRARTTLLRWHVGFIDPPGADALVPVDARSSIYWPSEGLAGVVAVFNGGFKKAANSGGSMVDGVTLEPLVNGDMTVALNAEGHWSMGVWGSLNFPPPGFNAIAYRQNLAPLVVNATLSPLATSAPPVQWGSPLGGHPLEPRSGLGVDAEGNLIYVASMDDVDVAQVGIALLRAGAVTGMELDMNPYWPILGITKTPDHVPGGAFAIQLPLSDHNASIYDTGWQRDFFVALAEPNSWSCHWSSPGLVGPVTSAQPQRLHLVGKDCGTTTPTTTTSTSTTTTLPTSTTTITSSSTSTTSTTSTVPVTTTTVPAS